MGKVIIKIKDIRASTELCCVVAVIIAKRVNKLRIIKINQPLETLLYALEVFRFSHKDLRTNQKFE